MRDLPSTTRVAIATLRLRHRAAREHAAHMRDLLGCEHPAALAAGHQEIEVWNSLQAVRRAVFDEAAGERISAGTPRDFMRLAAQGAKVRRVARERDMAQANAG